MGFLLSRRRNARVRSNKELIPAGNCVFVIISIVGRKMSYERVMMELVYKRLLLGVQCVVNLEFVGVVITTTRQQVGFIHALVVISRTCNRICYCRSWVNVENPVSILTPVKR